MLLRRAGAVQHSGPAMTTNSINTVSAYNTPQAVDDSFQLIEHILETFGYSNALDVMANDLAGKAKTLYAIDAGDSLSDLFQADAQVTFELSTLGATISIQNGKIVYDATAIASQINALGEGEVLTDTLVYAIRMANGTLSFGEVKVTISGTNDAAVVSGDIAGSVSEDAVVAASGTLLSDDVDGPDNSFRTVAVPTVSTAGYGSYTIDQTGNWSYTLDNSNAAVAALDTGETLTDTFTVYTADGTAATVTITIDGQSEGVTLPPVYNGADPNDRDGDLGTNPNIQGNEYNNPIVGTAGADTINGLDGEDTISGGSGADAIFGGEGNDIISGNVGLDTLLGQAGDDTINGDQNIDGIYGGSGNDQITGGDGNDIIYGGSGNDTINANGGGDTIIGGYGADLLTGGGNLLLIDLFTYLDVLDTGDTITDFGTGYDKIVLEAIDADAAVAGDQAFVFGGTTATAHGVWYADNGAGGVTVYVDTDGVLTTAELALTIDNLTTMTAADFVL